jgi:hypothetical protein
MNVEKQPSTGFSYHGVLRVRYDTITHSNERPRYHLTIPLYSVNFCIMIPTFNNREKRRAEEAVILEARGARIRDVHESLTGVDRRSG